VARKRSAEKFAVYPKVRGIFRPESPDACGWQRYHTARPFYYVGHAPKRFIVQAEKVRGPER
jgi:hypothetical protein